MKTRCTHAIAILLIALSAHIPPPACGGEVRIKLVAADRPDQPICSKLTDFRLSPFGGLIATQWLSGVTLNGEPLFLVQKPKQLSADQALEAEGVDQREAPDDSDEPADDLDKMIEDAKKESDTKTQQELGRIVDRVDELYRGKNFTKKEPTTIGPKHARHSLRTVPLKQKNLLCPGNLAFGFDGKQIRGASGYVGLDGRDVAVKCYPVRLSAVCTDGAKRRVPFIPFLSWGKTDLLRDMKFEHSPALPLGPPAEVIDERTSRPRFYDLTVYLLPTESGGPEAVPYNINGVKFHVAADGLRIVDGAGGAAETAPFSIQLLIKDKALAVAEVKVPFFTALGQGIEIVSTHGLSVPASKLTEGSKRRGSVTLRALASRESQTIEFQLPEARSGFSNTVVVCEAADGLVHVLAAAPSIGTREGRLSLHVATWTAEGPREPPAAVQAELRPLPGPVTGDQEPVTLAAQRSGKGLHSASVSEVPPGLYSVRLPELIGKATKYDFVICIIDGKMRGAISLFTHNSRCDYQQGEAIEVTAVLRAIGDVRDETAEIVLTHEGGVKTKLGTLTFAARKGLRTSRFFIVPAESLQTGRHLLRLASASGALLSHGMLFTVYPRERRTTWEGFATEICETGAFRSPEGTCNYNTMLKSPVETLETEQEKKTYLGQPTINPQLLPVCQADPLFPVEECTRAYNSAEQHLASAMRFGASYLPHALGGAGLDGQTASWNPKHTLQEDLDWMRRAYAQQTQLHREFASFGGFFINWYPCLGQHYEMHPARDGRASRRSTALGKACAEARGPLSEIWKWTKKDGLYFVDEDGKTVREKDVAAAGPANPHFHSERMRELREWKVKGARRRAEALPSAYAAWLETCNQLGQWNYLSFVPVGWFRGYTYYPPIYYATTPRAGIHAYTDWGFDPFMGLYGIDYYGAGSRKPPWLQMMSGDRNAQIRQMFLAAGRGAWGVGLGTGFHPKGRGGEDTRLICDMMHRYGPYFMSLEPIPDVAILRSFRQEAGDVGGFAGSGGRNGLIWFSGLQGELYKLYYNLLRSGRPAAFLTEEDIADGKLADYRALFLCGQRLPLPDPLMQKLRAFEQAGGAILKDAVTGPMYPGQAVDIGPDSSVKTNVGQSPHILEQRHLWILHNYLQCRAKLERALSRLPKPRVRSSHYHIVHTALGGKDTSVVFVANDTFLPSQVYEKWQVRQYITMTRKGQLYFDKPCYVYDVTDGGRETKLDAESAERPGTWEYPVAFLRAEGRVLVATEQPIRSVALRVERLSAGREDRLALDAAVFDDSGARFDDPLPFEIVLVDPHGRAAKRIYRALGPRHTETLTFGRNAAPGAWKVTVRELVTGRQCTATLDVDTLAAIEAEVQGDGKVLARRVPEIRRFLKQTESLTIILDEGQPSAYRDVLENLVAAVREPGKECEIVQVDSMQVHDLPLRWYRTKYDQQLWQKLRSGDLIGKRRGFGPNQSRDYPDFGYPSSGYQQPGPQFAIGRDVVVLGSPEDNRFIKDLHGTVNRLASPHCPGPGSALIQVTWDAFLAHHDALTIQVEDADGAEVGCDWVRRVLKELGERPKKPEPKVVASARASGSEVVPLPNLMRDGFGTPIESLRFLDGDRRLWVVISNLKMSGSKHFILDGKGKVTDQYGEFITLIPTGGEETAFIHDWRSQSSGGELVMLDPNMQPIWRIGKSGRWVTDPVTGDLFFSAPNSLARVSRRSGATVWFYDDRANLRNPYDFENPWKLTVHGVSSDGKFVLVSGFGELLYLKKHVTGYTRPAVLLLDAATGKVVWRKGGVMIKDTACGFSGDRIVACNSGDDDKNPQPCLTIWDLEGNVQRQVYVPTKIASCQLLGDGDRALVKGGAGLSLLDLRTGRFSPFPVSGNIKRHWLSQGRVIVSTWDGGLYRYQSDLSLVWRTQLKSPVSALTFLPDAPRLVVGTDSGHVLWLDEKGQVERTVDMNPHNITDDYEAWARRWRPDTSRIPVRRIDPAAGKTDSMIDQARKHADFSENLLTNASFEDGRQGWSVSGEAETFDQGVSGKALQFSGSLSQPITCKPQMTYVLSLYQRLPEGFVASDSDRLAFAVESKRAKFRYTAELPLSETWQERTVSFRTPENVAGATITFTRQSAAAKGKAAESRPVVLDRVELCAVQFRSPDLATQQKPTVTAIPDLDVGDEEGGLLEAGEAAWKPPEVKQSIPWVKHIGRALGQPEPKIKMPWYLMFDGKITGHESSWCRGGVSHITRYAQMTVSFSSPRKLALVALYEDSASARRYTDTFAVFMLTKAGWRLAGYRSGNRSPYHLFAFDPQEVKSLMYFWVKSRDNHIRVMELEAYAAEGDLLDMR